MGQQIRRSADAAVVHFGHRLINVDTGGDDDEAARRGVLEDIVEQVADDLFDPGRVGIYPGQCIAEAHRLVAGAAGGVQCFHTGGQQRGRKFGWSIPC